MTTDSQPLNKAYALREEGKFREAYDLFIVAANQTNDPLKKAGILLNATNNIKQAHSWKWLEYTCIRLGLKEEARHYGQLARPS